MTDIFMRGLQIDLASCEQIIQVMRHAIIMYEDSIGFDFDISKLKVIASAETITKILSKKTNYGQLLLHDDIHSNYTLCGVRLVIGNVIENKLIFDYGDEI